MSVASSDAAAPPVSGMPSVPTADTRAPSPAASTRTCIVVPWYVTVCVPVACALGKIDGVTLGDSAQLLGTHTVTYQGTTMLIRVEAAGEGARVTAVGTDGTPLTGGPAGALLAALKARLG